MTLSDNEQPAALLRPRAISAAEIPQQGERAFVVGQTGSGKTQFVIWLLERLKNSPLVIYDTKGEKLLDKLPRSIIVRSEPALRDAIDNPEVDYIVFKVPPEIIADPEALDALLYTHFTDYRGSDVYIDELFTFSQNGRAGPGLVALLTQGRSLDITTIMSAQRPSWLSRFALTESQQFYVFSLIDRKDKARLADVIPGMSELPNPSAYSFYYYRAGEPAPVLMARVLLDKPKVGAHTSQLQETDQPQAGPDRGTALNWI